MKYKLFFIAVLIVLFFNCKNEGPATDNQNQMPEASTEMVVNPDSLKKVYENKLAEKTKTLPVTQVREKGKLNPVDEAPVDTVFFLFREKLLDIIRQKDLVALLSNMKDNAKVSFGDPQEGPAGFVEIWGLDTPAKAKNSEVWKHLENALNLGGQFRDKRSTFIAPYVYSSFPDDYDAFEYHVITG